jgi:TolB-like protein
MWERLKLGYMGEKIAKTASDDEVRTELQRILSSQAFETSQRNRRFLSYVVEETLSGRSDRIKAYSIATSVFGRGDDFDPLQDSIVRIEAGRLRRALEAYYLRQEDLPGLRILVPKGTYVPDFQFYQPSGDAPARSSVTTGSRSLHEFGPRIMVKAFEHEGDVDRYPAIARTLTRQVISALTRFTEIFVYGFETTEILGESGLKGVRADDLPLDYELLGTVTLSTSSLRAELLLRKAGDGRFVWVHEIERALGPEPDPARVVSLCGEIAGHVARVLALRDGIMDSQARDSAGEAPRHFAGYQKLLDFQNYWRSLDPSLFEPLRQDLERTIASDPQFAAAFACLSMLYSNAARYGYDVGAISSTPLHRALELARKAIRLAPNSSRAYHARAIAEWFSGKPADSLATLQIARSLNPNDPELLAELGFRSAMRMAWETAVPLIEEAYLRNPLQTGQYRMGLFLYHFAEGRPERALQETRAIDAPGIAYVHLAAAAALSELGRLDEAGDRLREAKALAPGLQKLTDDLAFRQIHGDLIALITTAVGRIDSDWRPPVHAARRRPPPTGIAR